MRDADREYYRRELDGLRRRLVGKVQGLGSEAFRATGGKGEGSLMDMPGDAGDVSVDQYQHEVSVGMFVNENDLLRQTDEALRRLDEGTFGRCAECGTAIPSERLRLLPYTPHCLPCAQRLQGDADIGSQAFPGAT